jgi:hypothetical protein
MTLQMPLLLDLIGAEKLNFSRLCATKLIASCHLMVAGSVSPITGHIAPLSALFTMAVAQFAGFTPLSLSRKCAASSTTLTVHQTSKPYFVESYLLRDSFTNLSKQHN